MPTALYRRYRPESFADVIGQEHVTEPLMQALRADRTNHAYLFSGPRGCGKTTSARILARCLNCAQGPTDTPCGVCESCIDLSRGGGGSLDVVEIDAASHGGVDDARELRERAAIAPARDKYKVFVIDEAHMVTNQGFNALLKLVEEPPAHVKFVFATTEPDKVLPTIRSRTHHYPFHLVPPDTLGAYLARLCEEEKVPVGPGVLPLVVRAGGGSVRDSLSVLDQLMAGAGTDGLDQAKAAALLGYTEDSLLDDVVGAIAAVDGATLFTVVDRVLSSGQDPRRFVEDLLGRLRDLIVVKALEDRADSVLRGVAVDQLQRMQQQAASLQPAELSRAADVVNEGLLDMVGASSPRIQLELLCARLLLPSVDGASGHGARLDRIERRLAGGPIATPAAAAAPIAPPVTGEPVVPPVTGEPVVPSAPAQSPAGPPHAEPPVVATPARPASPAERPAQQSPGAAAASSAPRPASSGPAGEDATEVVRRFWPDVLNTVRRESRMTWSTISEYGQVVSCREGVLTIGIANPGALRQFASRSSHAEVVAHAVHAVSGLVVRVEVVPFDRDQAGPRPAASRPPAPTEPGPLPEPARAPRPDASHPQAAPAQQSSGGQPGAATRQAPAPQRPANPPASWAQPGSHARGDAPRREPQAGSARPARPSAPPPGWDDVPPPTEPPPDDHEPPPDEPVGWAVPGTNPSSRGGPPRTEPTNEEAKPRSRAAQMAQAAAAGRAGAGADRPGGPRAQAGGTRPGEGASPSDSAGQIAEEDEVSRDDPDALEAGMVGPAVVERLLGGKVIDES